ncbi:MAG: hypothetical protein II625_09420 [Bacilli bacterium]|nr:hypothetical protein [Bacilli bacterium]
MKLDSRIENENLIYTPFSNNEINLKGEGYFANVIGAFTDLNRCEHGTLDKYDLDKEYPYHRKEGINYAFFIPESNLLGFKKKKPKYVPFDTTHDLAEVNFHIGNVINFMNKKYPGIIHRAIITEVNYEEITVNYDEVQENLIDITLGSTTYNFKTLFDEYKYLNENEEWTPFGKRV